MTIKTVNNVEWHKIECLHRLPSGRSYSDNLGYIPVIEGAAVIVHCRECKSMQLWQVSPSLEIIKIILPPRFRVRSPGGRPWYGNPVSGSTASQNELTENRGAGVGEGQGGTPERETDRVNPVTCAGRTPSPQILQCT